METVKKNKIKILILEKIFIPNISSKYSKLVSIIDLSGEERKNYLNKLKKIDVVIVKSRTLINHEFLDNAQNSDYLVIYFDKYVKLLANNTLNSHIKGVVKH